MSCRPAATDRPSRPGLAVLALGAMGIAPPAMILVPQLAAPAPVAVERPDVVPEDFAAGRAMPHTERYGERP
ncbi:hypothetical protein AB0D04_32485 [Streptomyces sp. NPDC048483]|uniref:hypothetical protein n=1 Tax=Streptomyces sp. NPDC048483 TaxID=3154927 RepID=UPI00343CA177